MPKHEQPVKLCPFDPGAKRFEAQRLEYQIGRRETETSCIAGVARLPVDDFKISTQLLLGFEPGHGHFLARYAREMAKPTGNFAQVTLEVMAAYDWPGNVRELQNEVQRLVINVDLGGIVTADLLSPHVRKIEGLIARSGVTRGTLNLL